MWVKTENVINFQKSPHFIAKAAYYFCCRELWKSGIPGNAWAIMVNETTFFKSQSKKVSF
jgi:hypothetical protein